MQKILCATDETEVSRNAEEFAADLAKAVNAELCYIHVSPPRPGDSGIENGRLSIILDEAAARDHEILQNSMDAADKKGVKNVTCRTVRSATVVSTISGIAEKEGIDHILAGSTGREGIPRFLIGSVASGLIHKAHCPVTIVR
jgi:nucleotide-binding universal stress UspA family protein